MSVCCFRQEFVSDQCPDLTREVYLQDIHCVGSLCKLYFRELPNPLLTYELYKKFTVSPLSALIPNQKCGHVTGSPMTAVWVSVWCPGFWCMNLYKHFPVPFLSHLALAVFPCPCFFPPFMFVSLVFSVFSFPLLILFTALLPWCYSFSPLCTSFQNG